MERREGRASGRAVLVSGVGGLSVAVCAPALAPVPTTAINTRSTNQVRIPGEAMAWTLVAVLALVAISEQATMGCKNCIVLGKEERAMFRLHSDACLPTSRASARSVDALLGGELLDEPALRKHVYCVLLKCKLISKDGKLQKFAVLGKTTKPDTRNATKVLESCAEQSGDTPEDLAWNLFRCGYDKKALLFDYMPTSTGAGDIDNTN